MTIDLEAPVNADGEVTVSASPDAVWKVMTDIDAWPSWNPDVKLAQLEGELSAGTNFTWKAGPWMIRSTLTQVEEGSSIAWRGSMLGIKAHHVWRLHPTESGTRVSTAESWSGTLPRLLPSMMTKNLQKAIDSGLDALKTAVEAPNPPRP